MQLHGVFGDQEKADGVILLHVMIMILIAVVMDRLADEVWQESLRTKV